MKCPECVNQGLKSIVIRGLTYIILMNYHDFYDEDGIYHNHNYNDNVTYYSCTNNHNFKSNYKEKCPYDECDFNKENIK